MHPTSSTLSAAAAAAFGSDSPANSLKMSSARNGRSSASTAGTPKFSSASMKTSSAPASTDGTTMGNSTVRNACQRDAPRLRAASSIERSTALNPARVGSST